MKILYETSTGEVLSMGETPNLQPDPGQSIADVSFGFPSEPLNHFTFNGTALVRKDQSVIDKEDAIKNFNSKTFFGRLIQVFDASRWFGLSKLGVGWTMQQLVDYPNFSGLKAYATGLLMDQTITQDDADKINACLLEQGIDLNDF